MIDFMHTILSIVLTALCSYLVWLLQEQRKERRTQKQTYQILLRAEIRQLHHHYTSRGTISAEELGEVTDIYTVYHQLGGNGKATVMMQDLQKLERKD